MEERSLIDMQYVQDVKEKKNVLRICRDPLGFHSFIGYNYAEDVESFSDFFLNKPKIPRIPCLVVFGSCYIDPKDNKIYGFYRVISFPEGELILESKPIPGCNWHISAFLGIIDALKYQDRNKDRRRLYCDDEISLFWIYKGEVEIFLGMSDGTDNFRNIQSGVDYLHEGILFEHHLSLWVDDKFGCNPANFEGCTDKAFLHMQRLFPMNEQKESLYRERYKYYDEMDDILYSFGTPLGKSLFDIE